MKKRKYANRGGWIPLVLGLLLFAAVAVWMVSGVWEAAQVSRQEGLRMAQEALDRAVVSCYSLEGVYPATYEDLKAKSGLAIDEEKYAVFYDIFASNIRPTVTVVERLVEGS
ncbi:MAG: hypothetical protein HFF72_03515 [Oscillospiraceae bacterium]|jgi:hypothetical protein|nr:hypothetical protein [Oscillospiraceae bacterium]